MRTFEAEGEIFLHVLAEITAWGFVTAAECELRQTKLHPDFCQRL